MKKHSIFLIALVLFECTVWAQPDTIIAENTFKYQILDGKRTSGKHVIEQKTFDLQGKLIRQIFFSDSLMRIEKYTGFIYDNEQLISVETFSGSNDEIQEIKRYRYGPNHFISEVYVYKRINDNIKLSERIVHRYNDTVLIKKEIFNHRKKWLERTFYTQEENKNTELTQYRKGYSANQIKQQEVVSHMENGNILRSEIRNMYFSGESEEIQVEYQYQEKNNKVLKEIWRYGSDSVPKIKEFRYSRNGMKTGEFIMDENDNYIKFLVFERKKHDVIRGKEEMYDLKEK